MAATAHKARRSTAAEGPPPTADESTTTGSKSLAANLAEVVPSPLVAIRCRCQSEISYTLSLLIMSLCEIETVKPGDVFHWACSESPLCGRQHLVKQYMRLMVVDLEKEGKTSRDG